MTLAVIIMIAVLLIVVRILTRRRRNARKIRKAARKRARVHHGMRRTIKSRGVALGAVRMCSCGCGRTAGHCREMTARAEHPEGFLGPRKK